jgi:hypothetical protein
MKEISRIGAGRGNGGAARPPTALKPIALEIVWDV